jgi:hypothetical protein
VYGFLYLFCKMSEEGEVFSRLRDDVMPRPTGWPFLALYVLFKKRVLFFHSKKKLSL